MKSFILTTHPSRLYAPIPSATTKNLKILLIQRKSNWANSFFLNFHSQSSHFIVCCSSRTSDRGLEKIQKEVSDEAIVEDENLRSEVGNPIIPLFASPVAKLSLSDQAFFLLAFIACTTSVAFTSLVFTAVPTLFAMRNAAISLSKLADTAREELPSTMAAIRLSGMEISDLTLELSDLSQEIADGVNKSAQAFQAAETGVRQISTLAHQQTISMIEERANLPIISLQPVVAGAARTTSRAVGRATKTFINIISGREVGIKNDDDTVQF